MKIFNLHIRYLLSKINIIVISLILFFLFIGYLISINNLNESFSYEEIASYYFENVIYYTEIIMIFFSMFLFSRLCSIRNEYIINIVVGAGYTKKDNFNAMILSNTFILLLISQILLIIFFLIGYSGKGYIDYNFKYVNFFINIFMLCCYYGLLSYTIMKIFDNYFLIVLLFFVFIISDLFIGVEEFKFIYLYLFPNIKVKNGTLYISKFYVILLIVILYNFNKWLYINKDIIN